MSYSGRESPLANKQYGENWPVVGTYEGDEFEQWSRTSRPDADISEVKHLMDYSIIVDEVEPDGHAILIHTRPPKFEETGRTAQLDPDAGITVKDPNHKVFEGHPAWAPVAALRQALPDFDPDQVMVFTSARALDAVVNFLLSGQDPIKPCVLERVGETIFFGLDDGLDCEPDEYERRGWTQGFVRTHTRLDEGEQERVSTHRLLSYSFASMTFVVHFELDAYIPREIYPGMDGDDDGAVDVEHERLRPVRQEELVDVKTRKHDPRVVTTRWEHPNGNMISHSELVMVERVREERVHSLWVRDMRQLVVGMHEQGRFVRVERAYSGLPDYDVVRALAWFMEQLVRDVGFTSLLTHFELRSGDVSTMQLTLTPSVREWSLLDHRMRRRWANWR